MIDQNHIGSTDATLLGDKGIVTEGGHGRLPDRRALRSGPRSLRPAPADHRRGVGGRRPIACGTASLSFRNPAIPASCPARRPDATGTQVVLSLDRMTARLRSRPRQPLAARRCRFPPVRSSTSGSKNTACSSRSTSAPIRVSAACWPPIPAARASCKYGDVRRNTLGIKVVLADEDGTILDLTSRAAQEQYRHRLEAGFHRHVRRLRRHHRMRAQSRTACRSRWRPPIWFRPAAPMSCRCCAPWKTRLGAYLSAFEGMSNNSVTAALDHVPSLKQPVSGRQRARLCDPRRDVPHLANRARASNRSTRCWKTVLAEIWETDEAPLADAFVGPAHEMWSLRHALSEGVKHSRKADRLRSFLPQR